MKSRARIWRTGGQLVLAMALVLAAAPFSMARWMTMPDGVVLDIYDTGNQNWPRKAMLFVQPPTLKEWPAAELRGLTSVADAEATGGKALQLSRGTSVTWEAEFPQPSIYQVSVYARAAADKTPARDRAFMTLQVGDARPILMQINFRGKYACVARFLFHVHDESRKQLTLGVTRGSRTDFLLERVRLIDQLGNCARRAGKARQVLTTPAELTCIRRNAASEVLPQRSAEQWQDRYEAIWRMPPSPYLPLIGTNYKLPPLNPKTGKKAQWDLYPTARVVPRYKAVDRATGDVFPSNDYAAGDLTSGPFADDGWGWMREEDRKAGNRKNTYYFVAWQTGAGHVYQPRIDSWPNLAKRVIASAKRYYETGDPSHGREAAVMLAALACHYPLLVRQVLDPKHVLTGMRWTVFSGGGAWVYGAWQAAAMRRLAEAYDQVFPFLYPSAPADVVEFVSGKVPAVRSGEGLRALIETNILQYSADQCIRRHLMGSNAGWESCLATLAAVQQDPAIVTPWLEEMWTRCMFNNTNDGGLPDLITNGHFRDGANLIGQVNYAAGTAKLGAVADVLRRLKESGGPARFDLSDPVRCPKLIAACLFPLEVRAAGGFQSNVGEGYNHPWIAIRPYPGSEADRAAVALACEVTGDRRCAWVLAKLGREGESDERWATIEKDADACGDPFLHTRTRQLPGFGLAFLESGSDETDLAKKSALIMRTSTGKGHAHADTLDIELIARGARIVPDLATRYEAICYASRGHHVVEVDEAPFVNVAVGGPDGTAWVEALDEGGWIRFCQGAGRAARQPQVKLYRRAVALVDVPGGAYFVDIFRVRGGRTHTWCFHTQFASEFKINLTPGAPRVALRRYLKTVERPGIDKKTELAAAVFGMAPPVLVTEYTCAAGVARNVPQPVRVRSRLFGVEGVPMAVARGTGKIARESAPIRFIFVRREGDDLASRWLHLVEPCGREPILAEARELPVADPDNAAALLVTTAAGRRDLLVYNDTGKVIEVGGLKTDALFACVSREREGALAGVYFYGGAEVAFGGWSSRAAQAAREATIKSVDPVANALTLDRSWSWEGLKGRTLFIGRGPHPVSFDIEGAEGGRLHLKGAARVYQSPVARVKGAIVDTELALLFKNADPVYYHGMAVANGDHTRWWRVAATPRDPEVLAKWQGKTIPTDVKAKLDCRVRLDREAALSDFPVVEGRRMIYIYEFGPGDSVRMPTAVSLQRTAAGGWKVRTNVAVTITDPKGGSIEFSATATR